MQRINSVVAWYQNKIGTYDKQLWEKSVEETVLMNIDKVPRKLTKMKTDLIDVDLVRGSTFPKAKPQQGNMLVTISGLLRVVFFPLYISWWRHQTSTWFSGLLLFMYSVQIACLVVYYRDGGQNVNAEKLSLAHLYIPVITMCALGLVHSHIVATHSSHRHRPRTPDRATHKKRQKKHKSPTHDKENPLSNCTEKRRSHRHSNASDVPDNENHLGDVEDAVSPFDTYNRKKKLYRRRSPCYTQEERLQSMSRTTLLNVHVENRLPIETLGSDIKGNDENTHSAKTGCAINDIKCCSKNRNLSETGNSKVEHESSESHCKLRKTHTYTKVNEDRALQAQPVARCLGVTFAHTEFKCTQSDHLVYKSKKGEEVSCKTGESSACLMGALPAADGEMLLPSASQPVNCLHDLTHKSHGTTLLQESSTDIKTHSSEFYYIPTKRDLEISQLNHDKLHTQDNSSQDNNGDRAPVYKSRRESALVNGDKCSDCEDILVAGCDLEAAAMLDWKPETVGTLFKVVSAEQQAMSTEENKAEVAAAAASNTKASVPPQYDDDFGHESEKELNAKPVFVALRKSRILPVRIPVKDSQSSGESDTPTTPTSTTPKASELEWDDTMNSGDMTTDTSSACSSESEASEGAETNNDAFNLHHANSVMNNLASSTDKVSCIIWMREEVNKVDLSVLDLGWAIIRKSDRTPESTEYLWMGVITSLLLTCLPIVFRIHVYRTHVEQIDVHSINLENITHLMLGNNWRESLILINGFMQRFVIASVFFFLLSVAERTFKQRLLYAKHFCYLTSSRRAKKYDMPHFRLNKVRNIKTWLSLRSYLKKRGPQRSVDSIVSATFLLTVMFISLMCVELLHDSEGFLDHLGNWELVAWCLALGIYLLRFMTLGHKINKKYRNFSVLITEQINLYLHMEQKPHKKDELTLANNVLKLAEALLKELENPFKISGLSINPFLYNVTKVVILSAFSAVLTELLGFKLKLYKIKIK